MEIQTGSFEHDVEKPLTRKEKRYLRTRLNIITCAGEIIGEHGYAGCTISRLTEMADIAHGTFYLYFKSQQDLFDHVLPELGGEMLGSIAEAIRNSKDAYDLEEKGFFSNFDYLTNHPYMYRVTMEAEIFAPKSFREYQTDTIFRYAKSLKRSLPEGKRSSFTAVELEAIAAMLIGARSHLLQMYGIDNWKIKKLPDHIVGAYLRFVKISLKNLID